MAEGAESNADKIVVFEVMAAEVDLGGWRDHRTASAKQKSRCHPCPVDRFRISTMREVGTSSCHGGYQAVPSKFLKHTDSGAQ
jgi:hypothetical protein